jgi:hypothetical protein
MFIHETPKVVFGDLQAVCHPLFAPLLCNSWFALLFVVYWQLNGALLRGVARQFEYAQP